MYLRWLREELYLFIIGFMAKELGVDVSEVVEGGTLYWFIIGFMAKELRVYISEVVDGGIILVYHRIYG